VKSQFREKGLLNEKKQKQKSFFQNSKSDQQASVLQPLFFFAIDVLAQIG